MSSRVIVGAKFRSKLTGELMSSRAIVGVKFRSRFRSGLYKCILELSLEYILGLDLRNFNVI